MTDTDKRIDSLLDAVFAEQYDPRNHHKMTQMQAKAAINTLITDAVVAELESLQIGRHGVGPNGEDMHLNVPDYGAIWDRIQERINFYKNGKVEG